MGINSLVLNASAKINLALDILYKRNDGYHEVAMVMQTLALADMVRVSEQPEGITISGNMTGLDYGPSNLAYRAAALISDICALGRGINIGLGKQIPISAGLGGGSADAAAVLIGVNKLFDLRLTQRELERLAAQLGSDVPYCLQGGTMLATGRGEILQRLPDMPLTHIVLAKPSVNISTAWAYENYKPELVDVHPDINEMKACLMRQDLKCIAANLGNVLETVTIAAHPEIAVLKKQMMDCGAMACLMSGSGSTVFGLTEDQRHAEHLAQELRKCSKAQIIITKTSGLQGGEDGATVIAN